MFSNMDLKKWNNFTWVYYVAFGVNLTSPTDLQTQLANYANTIYQFSFVCYKFYPFPPIMLQLQNELKK